jgi:hypothetical protein
MVPCFPDVLRSAPNIHVSPTIVLQPNDQDYRYNSKRYGIDCVEGNGSWKNPYTYQSAAPVSPHYAIVDLWFGFAYYGKQHPIRKIFIKVNDWILEATIEGVISQDGIFTKLSL